MAAPYDAPIPGAPQVGQTALQAKTAYQNTLARINQKRQQSLRQYGYLGDIDQTNGTLSNVRVDPFNQYGGLQSMLRGQALGEQQAEYANEERGLHGGLANKAFTGLKYDEGAQAAQLGQDLTGSLADLQDQQTSAAFDRDRALYEAEQQAAQSAIANQDFNPADFSGLTYPAYGEADNAAGPTPGAAPAATPHTAPVAHDQVRQHILNALQVASKKAAFHNKVKKMRKGGR